MNNNERYALEIGKVAKKLASNYHFTDGAVENLSQHPESLRTMLRCKDLEQLELPCLPIGYRVTTSVSDFFKIGYYGAYNLNN